jgi:hypothetical protein
MSRRIRALAALTVALAATAVGCLAQGPPGTVVDRSNEWSPATKSRVYSLIVRTSDGQREKFQVLVADYDSCAVGASYPSCTKG